MRLFRLPHRRCATRRTGIASCSGSGSRRVSAEILSGEAEARLTYFAAHRWYGWSGGPLLMLDIGGGSMEIAHGRDEDPSTAISLPLGAGRLTGDHPFDHPATQLKALRRLVRDALHATAARIPVAVDAVAVRGRRTTHRR
jgi:exopolyphosphatase/pppGpp-phosphohydrolase